MSKLSNNKEKTRPTVRKMEQKILQEIDTSFLGTFIPGRNFQTILGQTTSMEHNSSKQKRSIRFQPATMQMRRAVVIRIPMRSPVEAKMSMNTRKTVTIQGSGTRKVSVLNIKIIPTRNAAKETSLIVTS